MNVSEMVNNRGLARAMCGYKWGKLDLSIRSVVCLNCSTQHDRDENAAKNIKKVGIGIATTRLRTQRESKTMKIASPNESSRITAILGR